MDILDKINEWFPSNDSTRDYHKLSEKDYIESLALLKKNHSLSELNQNQEVLRFLYSGCIYFCRFTTPSPFVFDPKTTAQFEDFLNCLLELESGYSENNLVYRLRLVRTKLYEYLDEVPMESINHDKIMEIKNDTIAYNIQFYQHKEKLKEFFDEQNILLSFIRGLLKKSIKTIIKTKIPIILSYNPLIVNFKYGDLPVKFTVEPKLSKPQDTFLDFELEAQSIGPSRWQSGFTDITIEISGFIDLDLASNPLQLLYNHDLPDVGWPKCFVIAYETINKVSWYLKVNKDGLPYSLPNPRDLADIESYYATHDTEKINWKKRGSPALLINAFNYQKEIEEINLDVIPEIEWSIKCKSLAIMYLELGQIEDSLFWINIAVESLFEERFEQICNSIGNHQLLEELNSPKSYWIQAEEIITKQFPDMKEKIIWPEKNIHPSLYTKIRLIYKNVKIKAPKKKILNNYQLINKNRNDLFHGRELSGITIDHNKKAIDSFIYIYDNFKVGKHN